MCKIKYKNVVTGLFYEVIEEGLTITGLRQKMEFSRDKIVGYTWLNNTKAKAN